jgi:error-prone DNA polymerase
MGHDVRLIPQVYVKREEGVVHLVAQRMFDLASDLASLGERDCFRLPSRRGNEFARPPG